MVEKIQMEIGYHKDSASACFGCLGGRSVISANSQQSIFLIIVRLDKNGNRQRMEPYCLTCSLLVMDKVKQEIFSSQKDMYYKDQYQKLSDFGNK